MTAGPEASDIRDDTDSASARRRPLMIALDAVLALMSILLVTQMWLLTATLESDLAGHHGAAVPGLVLSAVLFAACAALLGFVDRLDRRMK